MQKDSIKIPSLVSNADVYKKLVEVEGLLKRYLVKDTEEKITSVSLTELSKRMGWGKEKTRRRVIEAGLRHEIQNTPVRLKSGEIKLRITMDIVENDIHMLFEKKKREPVHQENIKDVFNKILKNVHKENRVRL